MAMLGLDYSKDNRDRMGYFNESGVGVASKTEFLALIGTDHMRWGYDKIG